jgi:hypothetical protein
MTHENVRAIAILERCVGIVRRDAGRRDARLVGPMYLLGSAYARVGQAFRAEATVRSAVSLAREHADQPRLGIALRELGNLVAVNGRPHEALPLLKEALAVARTTKIDDCCLSMYRDDLRALQQSLKKSPTVATGQKSIGPSVR